MMAGGRYKSQQEYLDARAKFMKLEQENKNHINNLKLFSNALQERSTRII